MLARHAVRLWPKYTANVCFGPDLTFNVLPTSARNEQG